MDTNERLNKIETKQETFEVWAKANLERLDEQAKQYAAEQAEWRKRHDEELREYREEMRQLKIASDQRFARIDEKFDRIDEKFDRIDEKFDRIDEKFDKLNSKISDMIRYVQGFAITAGLGIAGVVGALVYFVANQVHK